MLRSRGSARPDRLMSVETQVRRFSSQITEGTLEPRTDTGFEERVQAEGVIIPELRSLRPRCVRMVWVSWALVHRHRYLPEADPVFV
jgi:hypothetical protein